MALSYRKDCSSKDSPASISFWPHTKIIHMLSQSVSRTSNHGTVLWAEDTVLSEAEG